ncbi:hypothetical protein Hdeb2414_s0007g00250571 [Helianthus debilis subsp. tardiflorus]
MFQFVCWRLLNTCVSAGILRYTATKVLTVKYVPGFIMNSTSRPISFMPKPVMTIIQMTIF